MLPVELLREMVLQLSQVYHAPKEWVAQNGVYQEPFDGANHVISRQRQEIETSLSILRRLVPPQENEYQLPFLLLGNISKTYR